MGEHAAWRSTQLQKCIYIYLYTHIYLTWKQLTHLLAEAQILPANSPVAVTRKARSFPVCTITNPHSDPG